MDPLLPYEETARTACLFLTLLPWKNLVLQDERTQTLPESALLWFFLLSVAHAWCVPFFWESLCLLGGGAVSLCKILPRFLGKPLLGAGDMKLLSLCSLWLPVSSLPLFLILVGSVGCLRCWISHQRRIPFAFPIFCGWSVCSGLLWWKECGVLCMLY
ncbi:MAG: A24 family peptidase [Holosporales bacterium]|nr:A24 family peptidase [Holosporales bacterium]